MYKQITATVGRGSGDARERRNITACPPQNPRLVTAGHSTFFLARMKSSAPILPQVLLVAGAAAIGYAPELWPYGKISGIALIVSCKLQAHRVDNLLRSASLRAFSSCCVHFIGSSRCEDSSVLISIVHSFNVYGYALLLLLKTWSG